MTDKTQMGRKLDDRVGQGNANLIRAFRRSYGALLLLADSGFAILQADIGNDGTAALEIKPPTRDQINLFENVRRTPLAVQLGDECEGWSVSADIGGCKLCTTGNSGVTVWWYEPITKAAA